MIQTRAADLTDLQEIHRIEMECFGSTGVPISQLQWLLEKQGENPSLFIAVAFESENSELKGFICWKSVKDSVRNHFEILDLGVGKTFRDQGVENVLIEHISEVAKLSKAQGLTVMVPGANLGAMQFYARVGFFPQNKIDNIFMGDSAEIMTKKIWND